MSSRSLVAAEAILEAIHQTAIYQERGMVLFQNCRKYWFFRSIDCQQPQIFVLILATLACADSLERHEQLGQFC